MRWPVISLFLEVIMATAGYSLIQAAKNRDPRLLGTLLAQSPTPNVNQHDEKGRSVLFISSALGDIASVAMLCHKGADVNIPTNYNTIPLHAAVDGNYHDVCRILCKRDVKLNHQSINGDTPLHVAAMRGNGEIVEFLLNQGADCFIMNRNGRTALQEASLASCNPSRPEKHVHGDIVAIFKKHFNKEWKQNDLGDNSNVSRTRTGSHTDPPLRPKSSHHLELASKCDRSIQSYPNSPTREQRGAFGFSGNLPTECTFAMDRNTTECSYVSDRNSKQGNLRSKHRKSPEYHHSFENVTLESKASSRLSYMYPSRNSDPPSHDPPSSLSQRHMSVQNIYTPELPGHHRNVQRQSSMNIVPIQQMVPETFFGSQVTPNGESRHNDPGMERLFLMVENLQLDVVKEREKNERLEKELSKKS